MEAKCLFSDYDDGVTLFIYVYATASIKKITAFLQIIETSL